MTTSWYDVLVDQFRKHQEQEHPHRDYHYEVRVFEEELHYGERRDNQQDEWPCCWVDCKWHIKFKTSIKLETYE